MLNSKSSPYLASQGTYYRARGLYDFFKNCLPVCNDFSHSVCPILILARCGRMRE